MTSSPNGCILSLKVMMILREPVSRELSAYNHWKDKPSGANWSLKKNYTSFDEYVNEELILVLTSRPTLPKSFPGKDAAISCRSQK